MIKIDKNIPIPESGSGRPLKFPFREMEVGDSFEIEVGNYKSINSLHTSIVSASIRYCRDFNLPYKFTTHKTEKGVRIWRVE